MAEKAKKAETGSLTSDALESGDVLEGAEEWSTDETKLVVWSLAVAVVVLIIGLFVVPTSIVRTSFFH